jgi:hypothetical protein
VEDKELLRFGAEFGPKRGSRSSGVSLSTFKTLVWVSNIGGLVLFVIGLELMVVMQSFYLGLGCIVAGIIIALFPSNYEIVGMDDLAIGDEDGESEEEVR